MVFVERQSHLHRPRAARNENQDPRRNLRSRAGQGSGRSSRKRIVRASSVAAGASAREAASGRPSSLPVPGR